VRRSRQQVNTP
jgi:Protein of unknown function (DUF2934)